MFDPLRTRERFDNWLQSADFQTRYSDLVNPRGKLLKRLLILCLVIFLSCVLLAIFAGSHSKSGDNAEHQRYILSISRVMGVVLPLGVLLGSLALISRVKHYFTLQRLRKRMPTYELALASIVDIKPLVQSGVIDRGPGVVAILTGKWDESSAEEHLSFRQWINQFFFSPPESIPAGLHALAKGSTHLPGRWRTVPKQFTDNKQFHLCDIIMHAACFGPRSDSGFVLCAVSPDHRGTVYHLPESLIEWSVSPGGSTIVRHSDREIAPEPTGIDPTPYAGEFAPHLVQSLDALPIAIPDRDPQFVRVDIFVVPASEHDVLGQGLSIPTGNRDYHTLITCGMSSKPMNVPPAAMHLTLGELVIRLPKDWSLEAPSPASQQQSIAWIVQWMRGLARFPHAMNSALLESHTFQCNPPEPIAEGVPFTGWLLVKSATVPPLKCSDGKTIHFHSLIPIHPSEMEFKINHGADKLTEKLLAAGVSDIFDINRKPVV